MTTYLFENNDSYKSVKSTPINLSPRTFNKHAREEFRCGESPVESSDGFAPRSTSQKSRKRFKPDVSNSRHRICHGSTEENQTDSCYKNSTQTAPQAKYADNPIPSTTSNTDEGEGSQGNGNSASGEDDGEDSDNPADLPYRQSPNSILPDSPQSLPENNEKLFEELPDPLLPEKIPTLTHANSSDRKASFSTSDTSSSNQQNIIVGTKIREKTARKKKILDPADLSQLAADKGFKYEAQKPGVYLLRCPQHHKVIIKDKDPIDLLTCKKCDKKMVKCREYAQSMNGKVLNLRYEDDIQFECEKGHDWKIKYSKYMFSRWCPKCEKMKRDEKKRQLEEEAEKIRKQIEAEQNAKLEEARIKMLEEERMRYLNYQAWFYQWPTNYGCQNFMNDESVNALSKEWTIKYLKENPNIPAEFEDIFLLYKILITAKEMLIAKLMIIPKTEQASFYRKCAIKLHPDKNRNPRANEAFQKFTECYKYVTGSQNNACFNMTSSC